MKLKIFLIMLFSVFLVTGSLSVARGAVGNPFGRSNVGGHHHHGRHHGKGHGHKTHNAKHHGHKNHHNGHRKHPRTV